MTRHEAACSRFWKQFLNKCNGKTTIFSRCRGTKHNRIGATHDGIYYQGNIRQHDSEVHAYIDFGLKADNKDEAAINNTTLYNALRKRKKEIEDSFGGALDWIDDDDIEDAPRRRCIRKIFPYGLKDSNRWDSLQNEMIKAIVRLEDTLRLHIADILA